MPDEAKSLFNADFCTYTALYLCFRLTWLLINVKILFTGYDHCSITAKQYNNTDIIPIYENKQGMQEIEIIFFNKSGNEEKANNLGVCHATYVIVYDMFGGQHWHLDIKFLITMFQQRLFLSVCM